MEFLQLLVERMNTTIVKGTKNTDWCLAAQSRLLEIKDFTICLPVALSLDPHSSSKHVQVFTIKMFPNI
jgi:hypothetical protein